MVDHTPDPLLDPTALRLLNAQAVRGYALHFVALGVAAAVGGVLVALVASRFALAALFLLVGLVTIALGRYVGAHSAVLRPFVNLARIFWIVLALACVVAVVASLWEGHRWLGWIAAAVGLADGLVIGHLVDHAPAPGTPVVSDRTDRLAP